MLDKKAQKAQKFLILDLVCTPVLISDITGQDGGSSGASRVMEQMNL